MQQVVSLAVHVAPSDAPVLVTGPAGSGKEKLAEIVQSNSRRKQKPFVKVNAGGLPDDLLEAELFGAEAGAFTGAQKLRIGRFEAAHGGTLFLDEIGNLSLGGQARLLRVLQTGEFERLGSSATRKVDVRIVSATNADLQRAIGQGRFREDLYFRLNVIELKLPPLAERPDDILPLAEHFLASFDTAGDQPLRIADDARAALCQYEWPGNVRELHNRMHRASLICSNRVVRTQDLGLDAAQATGSGGGAEPTPRTRDSDRPGAAPGAHEPERALIEEALLRASGVVSKAAAELGMSRQALYRRMERLGIVLERRPKL
jgi:DNA-binding NtrC family response regulator